MENSIKTNHRPTLIFLSLTFLLSSIFYYLIIDEGNRFGAYGLHLLGIMWCPGIAALITMKILKRSWRDLGWKWGKTKYQIQSYLLPLIYAFFAYALIWSFGWGGFYNQELVTETAKNFGLEGYDDMWIMLLFFLLIGTVGMILEGIQVLGEEIGWRGFWAPELYKTQGFTRTSLITGIIWGLWHAPILFWGDYNGGTPGWYSFTCFMIMIISISFIITWFRMKSGSLWTATIFHTSHNIFIIAYFTPLTEDTGNTAYFMNEFGIVVPIITLGFALYYWNRRKELEAEVSELLPA